MTGTNSQTPTEFGYRSSTHGRNGWLRWLLLAFAALEILRISLGGVTGGQMAFSSALVVCFVADFAFLTWIRRVLVTELRVTGSDLVANTGTASHRVDLTRTKATAVTTRHTWHRLAFDDSRWLRVAIPTRDWGDFVTALEAAQGSLIDTSATGRIREWPFGRPRNGYFEHA